MAAFRMASEKAVTKGLITTTGDNICFFCFIGNSRLLIIKDATNAVISCNIYRNIPKYIFFQNAAPTTNIKKVGPVLLATLISTSASAFDIYPFWYSSAADLAPKGKPHRAPSIMGAEAHFGSMNKCDIGSILPSISAAPLETIRDDITI